MVKYLLEEDLDAEEVSAEDDPDFQPREETEQPKESGDAAATETAEAKAGDENKAKPEDTKDGEKAEGEADKAAVDSDDDLESNLSKNELGKQSFTFFNISEVSRFVIFRGSAQGA